VQSLGACTGISSPRYATLARDPHRPPNLSNSTFKLYTSILLPSPKPYKRPYSLGIYIYHTHQTILVSTKPTIVIKQLVSRPLWKCDWQHSKAHPRKPHYRRKNLAKISYASRVIAKFVPNFVAMATGVGRGKMRLAAFDMAHPQKPHYRRKIFFTQSSYSQFCSKFRCHGNGGQSGINIDVIVN